MKFCTSCGKAMDDNYAVCPYCGVKVEDQNEDAGATQFVDSQEPNQNAAAYSQSANPYGQHNNPYGQMNNPYGQQSYNQGANANYAPPKTDVPEYTPAPRPQRSAYIAAFLAFFGGAFGLYNFYLDRKNKALIQLLVSLLGSIITFGLAMMAMQVWAIIEGIKILKGEINTDGTGEKIKMGF